MSFTFASDLLHRAACVRFMPKADFPASDLQVDCKHVLHTGKYESFIASALQFLKILVVPSPINQSMERLASSLTSSAFLCCGARFRKPLPTEVTSAWNQAVLRATPCSDGPQLSSRSAWNGGEGRGALLGLMRLDTCFLWREDIICCLLGCSTKVHSCLGALRHLPIRTHWLAGVLLCGRTQVRASTHT